ncbi:MAG: hypothetical protein ACOYEO_07325, partial [bacterium]
EFTATSMGSDESLLFNTPNAKAIVSAGCLQPLDLPKMDRVIGKCIDYIPYDKTPLDGPVKTTNWMIRGGLSQVGESMYTSFKF